MKADWKNGTPKKTGRYLCCYICSTGEVHVTIKNYSETWGWYLGSKSSQERIYAWDYLPDPDYKEELLMAERGKIQRKIEKAEKQLNKLREEIKRLKMGD